MRELLNEDMYLISEIIDRMNLEMPPVMKKIKDEKGNLVEVEKNKNELGSELIVLIVKRLHLAKEPVDILLSHVLEKNIEEVKKMKLKETIEIIGKTLNVGELKDFFS